MPDDLEPFHVWLADQARRAGYEIDGPRSGGKAKLAEDSGVSRGQVGRALAGETIPDVRSQRGLAKALNVPLREMLIRSRLVEPEDLPEGTAASSEPPTSYEIEQRLLPVWASDLGITESRYAEWLRVVKALSKEYARGGGSRSA